MIDWIGVSSASTDITIKDITNHETVPWDGMLKNQPEWFYTSSGRLVQIAIVDGHIEIEITDNSETTKHVIELEFNGKRILLDDPAVIVGGWSENDTEELSQIAEESTKRRFVSHIISTISSRHGSKRLLRFIIAITRSRYMGLIEFLWDGKLTVGYTHTQGLRSKLYYLTEVGYCSVENKNGKVIVHTPYGEVYKLSVLPCAITYDQYSANQYGLIHYNPNYYIQWLNQPKHELLDDSLRYTLNNKYLLWQSEGQINILDITNGRHTTIESELHPMAFDEQRQIVVARATDGVVLYRTINTMPVYYLSPLNCSLKHLCGDLKLNTENCSKLAEKLINEDYSYQLIPERGLLIIRYCILGKYISKMYKYV